MRLVTSSLRERRPAPVAAAKDLILYVEDEEDNRNIAAMRLGERYALLFATNDREACECIAANHGRLSAILMDIQLKGSQLDGIQIVKLCRGTLPADAKPAYAQAAPVVKTPILFVTAFAERYSEADLLGAGGDCVITKPVEFGQLTLALTNLHLERTVRRK